MSANRSRPHNPMLWIGFHDVDAMISHGVTVTGSCERCARSWPLDLEAIRKKRGPHWTLVGRRIRCAKRHDAALLAHAPRRPAIPVHFAVAEEWSDTKRLQARCGWCGKGLHG